MEIKINAHFVRYRPRIEGCSVPIHIQRNDYSSKTLDKKIGPRLVTKRKTLEIPGRLARSVLYHGKKYMKAFYLFDSSPVIQSLIRPLA